MVRLRDFSPSISDISYTEDLHSFANYELNALPDDAYRALMALIAACAYSVVDTYTAPKASPCVQDLGLSRLTRTGTRRWQRIRPLLEPFFRISDGFWFLDRDWIKIGEQPIKRPAIPAALRSAVMRRDEFTCMYCGSKQGPFHCDHIVALSHGGATSEDNLICACAGCNLSKKDFDADEWIARMGTNVIPLRGGNRG